MTRIDKACYERGCACHDDRVDGETVEVVQREWVGLTEEEINNSYLFWVVDQQDIIGFGRSIETKLRKKNT